MIPKKPSKVLRKPEKQKYKPCESLEPEVQSISEHYNRILEQSESERREGRLFGLRRFNNWIKAAVIKLAIQSQKTKNIVVLDLCCGKGGDIRKWIHPYVLSYLGLDVANKQLEVAERRYKDVAEIEKDVYSASFFCVDCFKKDALKEFGTFNILSCMFAFHYSFCSKEKTITALSNVSEALMKGGNFILTIPCHKKVKEIQDASITKHGKYETSTYEVEIQTDWDFDPSFEKIKYRFFLENSVNNLSEHSIPLETLISLAKEKNLILVLCKTFSQFYHDIKEKRIEVLANYEVPSFLEKSLVMFKEIIDFYVCLIFTKN